MKKMLRKIIRERKKQYSESELQGMSENIWKQVEEMEIFRQVKKIAAYWSMPDEVYTHNIVQKWAESKSIFLPCIVGNDLVFHRFSGISSLETEENFGIPEPRTTDVVDYNDIDLIIVPGIAFDKKRNRLGRGKGFYDRFLRECPAFKVGVCFPFQFFEENIPTDEYDMKMDIVIK